jgi:hypothetical protein
MSYVRPIVTSIPYVLGGSKPMFKLCIDTVGPFPKDEEDNEYIVVIIDSFTRYVTLHPCKDTSGKSAGIALFEHCCTYGVPKEIHTDNGSQFKNSLISTMTTLFNLKHNLSIAYSSQENGLAERVIKEVNRHLRILTSGQDKSKQWSNYIPLVQRIINGSEHNSVGYSPAQLVFGDTIDLKLGLFPSPKDSEELLHGPVDDEWVRDKIEKQAILLDSARKHQDEINDDNIRVRNKKGEGKERTSYPINSYVLAKYPHSSYGRGPPSRLLPFWRGPMLVEEVVDDKYSLRNLVTGKVQDFHVQLLKPFIYDERVTTPLEIAIQEDDGYIVDSILEHRHVTGSRTAYEYRVRWLGYQDTSWEPLQMVRKLGIFHEYARKHKLIRFIPKAYR